MAEHVPLYASAYTGFSARDAVRRQTYGDDLGQSGWLSVDELERFAEWLDLDAGSRLLDVGVGCANSAGSRSRAALMLSELVEARETGRTSQASR